jgi:hypothetical protein
LQGWPPPFSPAGELVEPRMVELLCSRERVRSFLERRRLGSCPASDNGPTLSAAARSATIAGKKPGEVEGAYSMEGAYSNQDLG